MEYNGLKKNENINLRLKNKLDRSSYSDNTAKNNFIKAYNIDSI